MNLPWPMPLQMAVAPKRISEPIRQIARSLVGPQGEPRFVPVEPLDFCTPQNCHVNVMQAVRRLGGTRQGGWAVSHVPGEYYEFVGHSIWVNPDSRWVDVTPDAGPPRRLFVPDESVVYDGSPIPTRFFADGAGSPRIEKMNMLARRVCQGLASADRKQTDTAHAELSHLVVACLRRSAARGWKL